LFDSTRTYSYSTTGQQHSGAIHWTKPDAAPLKLGEDVAYVGQSPSGAYLLTRKSASTYELNASSQPLDHVPDGPINNNGRFLSGLLAIETNPVPPVPGGGNPVLILQEKAHELPGLVGGRTIAINNYDHVLGSKSDGTHALWLWREGAYAAWSLDLHLPAGATARNVAPTLTDRGLFVGQVASPDHETVPTLFVPAGLYVDADRDGQIALSDKTSDTAPYAFLLNDDHDRVEPGFEPDAANNVVDGAHDLQDFFPVFLDIQTLVSVLPPSAFVKYKLRQADGALNFVYTNLTRETAFAYKNATSTDGFGPAFAQAASAATVQQITPAGVELSEELLKRIRNQKQGVILVEGRAVTAQPLVLSIEQNGTAIGELLLPLRSIHVALAVDANGDGLLKLPGEDDTDNLPAAQPFPIWLNQNDDAPGQTYEMDSDNAVVDGIDDLKDFFPVFLDIKELMGVFPPDASVKYKLRQEEGALNFVYTNLTPATAFSFRGGTLVTGFGPGFDQPAATATTRQITATGIELSDAFLERIKHQGGGVILVEGRLVPLHPLVLSVEKNGVVVAEVNLSLQPVIPELGVDANRDGTIKLLSEDGSDVTSAGAPFRFWLNEGVDEPGPEGEQTMEPGTFGTVHDYQSDRISYKRDLEDWSRLRLSIPAVLATSRLLQPLVDSSSGLAARLEWKAMPESGRMAPTLKFVAAVTAGKEYLKDAVVAGLQIEGDQGKVIGQVGAGTACAVPAALWQSQADGRLEANLLFEGAGVGDGQLTLVLYKNGQRLGEAGAVQIQIRRMQDLYEHWTANAEDTDKRGAAISPDPVHPLGSNPAPFEFTSSEPGLSLPADAEGNDYILFVHGWRMKPWERRAFAETAAKRLYQLGYRGKFGFFSWPSEWVNLDVWYAAVVNSLADPDHYDRCEVLARTAGHGPLAKLLTNLRGKYGASHIHLFAHSMGNIVVSEALRALPANEQYAAQYVACQSAEVASAYENFVRDPDGSPNGDLPSASPALGGPDRYTHSAPIVRDSAEAGINEGENYHKGVSSRLGVMANFYNGGDAALSKWDINQKLKPDHTLWPRDTAYSYDSVPETSTNPARARDRYQEDASGFTGQNQQHELHWDSVAERHRILAFIVQARSKATGATTGIKGEFQGTEANLSEKDYSFEGIHSAEFLGDPIKMRKFYQQLIETFDLKRYETQ
jgi:hypothetical protein